MAVPHFTTTPPQPGYQLFIAFLEAYLQIQFCGFQSGFGVRKDLILFRSPSSGSTLAVPTDTMLLSQDMAREVIQSKIAESERAFGGKAA
jgi:hypothetical protein